MKIIVIIHFLILIFEFDLGIGSGRSQTKHENENCFSGCVDLLAFGGPDQLMIGIGYQGGIGDV